MLNRWYIVAVLACWIASMSWLLVEKVMPTLREGDRPQYAEVLPAADTPLRPVRWEIQYGNRTIGQATSLSTRDSNGAGRMESTVQFDDLPLGEMMSENFGMVGTLLKPLWNNDDNLRISMTIASEMEIDREGKLDSFVTNLRMAELPDLIRIEGEVHGAKLHVAVLMANEHGEMEPHFRDEVEIASEALVSGSFSPQERLTNLEVGQTWTMPVYRPFPPNSPVQMLQATVERYEVFIWNDRSLKAYQVVYRDDAGSGITIAREPIGRMWVRGDGEVLQQEARIANMRFRFVRLPAEEAPPQSPAGSP